MGLITPTYADKVKEGTAPHQGNGATEQPRIVANHEPMPTGVWVAPAMPFPTPQTGIQEPPPETKKRVRRSKVQEPVQVPVAVAPPLPLKVACIGTAPSSRMMAPFNDPSWQIWCCSPGNQGILPRVDAWFEIHCNLHWPEFEHYGKPYIKWLSEQKFPVYMQDQFYFPHAITYPIQEMVKTFGPYHFKSSFSYMMALAIYKGAQEIMLCGIDMASHEEYLQQRDHFFFEEGAKHGCKVWAPFESDIMQPPPLYGYSDRSPLGRKVLARSSELNGRLAQKQQERTQVANQLSAIDRDIVYLSGAKEDVGYFTDIWLGAQDNPVSAGSGYLDRLLQVAKLPSQG